MVVLMGRFLFLFVVDLALYSFPFCSGQALFLCFIFSFICLFYCTRSALHCSSALQPRPHHISTHTATFMWVSWYGRVTDSKLLICRLVLTIHGLSHSSSPNVLVLGLRPDFYALFTSLFNHFTNTNIFSLLYSSRSYHPPVSSPTSTHPHTISQPPAQRSPEVLEIVHSTWSQAR